MVPRRAAAKATAVAVFRRCGLLAVVDRLRRIRSVYRNRRRNSLFVADNPAFPVPPPALAFEAHDHVDWSGYRNSGLADAGMVKALISRHHRGPLQKICEWGCGPGRVIRHLSRLFEGQEIELFGTDADARCTSWCQAHLPAIRFAAHDVKPPLPFARSSFDCVYALSVFTHLSERSHRQWVDELWRVVRPGGTLVFTTHGDWYRHLLSPAELRAYASERPVERGQVHEGCKFFTMFHPPGFVRGILPPGSELLEHVPGIERQDVWVVRTASPAAAAR